MKLVNILVIKLFKMNYCMKLPFKMLAVKVRIWKTEKRNTSRCMMAKQIQALVVYSILVHKSFLEIVFSPIFICALNLEWQIQQVGMSINSAACILVVIQSRMHSSCTQAMLPPQLHTDIKGFVESQHILQRLSSTSSGFSINFYDCSNILLIYILFYCIQ